VPHTLGDLGVRFGCVVQGDPDTQIVGVGTLQQAGPDQIAFLANPLYRKYLAATRAGAVILKPAAADDYQGAALLAENPYLTYARVAALLCPPPSHTPGISAAACVDPGARIDANAGRHRLPALRQLLSRHHGLERLDRRVVQPRPRGVGAHDARLRLAEPGVGFTAL